MLYIIPTPIGNLKDITLRALEVLQGVDAIICEDTRRASILLNHYQIKKPFIILNDYNEAKVFPQIISRLQSGSNLALISDAGTPLISDPGFKLVREVKTCSLEVDSLPGPSSVTTALTLSGLAPDKFMFIGYLPEKPSHRLEMLNKLSSIHQIIPTTFIIFVSPYKLIKTLEEIKNCYGENTQVALAKELSKIHQEVTTKQISAWLADFAKKTPKGEWILLMRLT